MRVLTRAHRLDQHVLALARHEPRHAHDERTIADAEAFADGAPVDGGSEPHRVHTGIQDGERRRLAERGAQQIAGVRADRGDGAAGTQPPALRRGEPGRPRDPHLGPVREGDRRDAPRREPGRDPGKRKAVPEEDDVGAMVGRERDDPPLEVGGRPDELLGPPLDGVGLRLVVVAPAGPHRRQDRDAVGGEARDEPLDVLLDPADARRKVVRDDQRSGDVVRSASRPILAGGGNNQNETHLDFRSASTRPVPSRHAHPGLPPVTDELARRLDAVSTSFARDWLEGVAALPGNPRGMRLAHVRRRLRGGGHQCTRARLHEPRASPVARGRAPPAVRPRVLRGRRSPSVVRGVPLGGRRRRRGRSHRPGRRRPRLLRDVPLRGRRPPPSGAAAPESRSEP